MNSKNFEIILMKKGNEFISSYSWYEIPQVNDHLTMNEEKIFIVRSRLLPMSDSNKVVLFGDIISV